VYRSLLFILISTCVTTHAQNVKNIKLPTTASAGFHGSVGAGFVDFTTLSPSPDFKLERGAYLNTGIERAFEFMHLYLTLGLSYLDAEGLANYDYSNLTSSNLYSIDDLSFRMKMYELSLGLKLKLIDDYWFRPYIEGGGIGSYNEITYNAAQLRAFDETVGTDYKKKDVIMGSGYYGEAGIEVAFTERFGVRLAARQTFIQTKKLDTLEKRTLLLRNEVYYFSLTFGM
jgi:hypothetical protein